MHTRHPRLLWWSFTLTVLACSDAVPEPRFVRQETSALVEVGFPPPPARIEAVPPQPSSAAVWIDGEWVWSSTRWAWKYGSWVVPPAGAAYSPWTTARSSDATLYFAPGVWRDPSGAPLPAPAALAVGRASHDDVIAAEGEVEKTGRNVRPEGATRVARSRPSRATVPAPTLDPGFFGDAGLPDDAGPPNDPGPPHDASAPADAAPPPPDAGRMPRPEPARDASS